MASKIIVITGANGGLGRALARQFAADGHTIVLLGRTFSKVNEVAESIGRNAIAIECVVSSPDSVRAAFTKIREQYGRIDALINNAALFQMTTLEEASDDKIIDAVMTNLAGPMLCARSAIPLLEHGGHIINVSSESVEITLPHLIPYQATKAGLEQFSRDLNLELFDKGIRVSAVRAGQMIGDGTSTEHDPESIERFFKESSRRGHNPMERGVSRYDSVVFVFQTIINAPADVQIDKLTFQARPAA